MLNMFAFSCPVCARITEYPLADMVEGFGLNCPFCKCSIRLHGHMLEYVQKEIAKLEKADPSVGDR
jgi:hypothetical protein